MGAGFKTWVAGERVDADDFQGYVQDQVNAAFASTSARDTAITSPAEPMVAIITGDNRIMVYDGSAWVIPLWYAASGRVGGTWTRVANQAALQNATTPISWDTEVYDSHGFLAVHATTGTAFTVPTGMGGLYAVSTTLAAGTQPGDTGGDFLTITAASVVYRFAAQGAQGNLAGAALGPIPLAAGEGIEVAIRQTANASANYTGRLNIYRVGM